MTKVFALAAVLLAGVGYLVYSSTQGSAEYYQTISEMRAHPQSGEVRVVGVVQPGVEKAGGGVQVHFTMADDAKQSMAVDYKGTLPDIFKPGTQVVVQGKPDGRGTFQARELQAKCPSRFTAATPSPGGGR
jgi:cytochrome c-type biogenesis protein CcmE